MTRPLTTAEAAELPNPAPQCRWGGLALRLRRLRG